MSYVSMLAEDRKTISYRPTLAKIAGSVTGAIFLQQVLFRWQTNGRKPFYKFSAPCDHPLYREGDSWQEELHFTRAELEGARAKVAIKRKKGEPMGEELVAYWVDMERKTWYSLNEPALENALIKQYVLRESSITYSGNPEIDNTEITTETTTEGEEPHAPASIDDLLPQDNLYRDGMTKAEVLQRTTGLSQE